MLASSPSETLTSRHSINSWRKRTTPRSQPSKMALGVGQISTCLCPWRSCRRFSTLSPKHSLASDSVDHVGFLFQRLGLLFLSLRCQLWLVMLISLFLSRAHTLILTPSRIVVHPQPRPLDVSLYFSFPRNSGSKRNQVNRHILFLSGYPL